MKIVNIVASGHLGVELNLDSLYRDLNIENIQYDPESFPGLQIRFTGEGPVITLFSSGSYTIMGAETYDQVYKTYNRMTENIKGLNINYNLREDLPEIQNLICKDDIGREVDLEALILELGAENTEYEPAQSAFLYYRPEEVDCLIMIPANGQCTITGVSDLEECKKGFENFEEKIEGLFN